MLKNKTEFPRKRLIASVISAITMSAALAVQADADTEKFNLDIKSQSAGPALVRLGQESGVQIIFPSEMANTIKLAGISGQYTLSEALDAMLNESGLIYQFTSESTIVVKESDSSSISDEDEQGVDEEVVVVGQRIVTRNRVNKVEPVLVYRAGYFERYEPLTLNDMLEGVQNSVSA